MAKGDPITAQQLRSLLDYDPTAGLFRWRIDASTRAKKGSVAGTVDRDGYIVIRIAGRGYKAHRLAWLHVHGSWPASLLDHENRVRSDNRIVNLREADDSQNQLNSVTPLRESRSGIRGVSWFAQYQKWKASITVRGTKFFLGHFDRPGDAQEAYLKAKARVERGDHPCETQS